jgi:hypothetical protein
MAFLGIRHRIAPCRDKAILTPDCDGWTAATRCEFAAFSTI